MKLHSGEEQNKCDKCDYVSLRQNFMKTHIQMFKIEIN